MPVADEVDAADTGNRALVDLEAELDPVLIELNALGLDGRGEMPAAAVEIEDALHISLPPRAGNAATRPKLHLRRDNVVPDSLIPLAGQRIDLRNFHHSANHRLPNDAACAQDAQPRP